MKNIYLSTLTFFFIFLFTISGFSQNGSVPELMYYKFDGSGTTVPNGASTPVGTNPAPMTTVTQGGTGQFGGALIGAGAGSLATGWATSLTGDWTMSFWIDFGSSAATFQYFFGDAGANSFRAFANGAAGVGNIVLRGGGLTDIVVTGVADGLPHVVHYVYSSAAGNVKAYKDGILNNTVAQIVAIPTGTGMLVGAYTSSLQIGAKMDEFRLYNRALDQTEITDTWNNELPLSFAPDDVGVLSVGPPGAFCPGVQNVDATIQNYGTNQVDSFMVHWSINSVLQTSQSVLTPLDTFGGVGSHQTTLTLGTNNFILAQTYTIEAWTTLPNGVADTITGNDSATTTLTVTVPGVNALGASNIIDVAADINWTELGTASQWHVELGLSGFIPGTGSKFFTTNNPHSLSGLTQNTLYDFYVRSICGPGDTSTWIGPGTFLTTCAISTAPFLENFDGVSWTGPGLGSIDQCWARDNTTTPYWQVDNNGTGSGSTGPALDASGLGNYLYLETSGGSIGDSGVLESPWIDFSTTLAPELSFEYHMFGATMGTLKVQASSDGSNWTNMWSITGQQHISDSDPWSKAIVSLVSFSGDTAKVRFVGIRGTSFTGDMAIDEVRLREPPAIDIGLVAIDSPNTACGMDSIEDVTLRFASFGFDTINTGTTINMNYSINGGAYVSEIYTVTSDIFIGDTLPYTFTIKANLFTAGNYNFKAFASIVGDGDPINDTLEKFVASIPVVSTFPYFENFESGQGGWTSSGTNSTWAYGTPAKTTIIGASSGTNAWVTGGLTGSYNANEVSYVTGPCFDLSTMVRPGFDLKVWWNSEFSWDGARLEVSSNAGTTWNVIGNFGDPNNWYTDNSINGMPIGQQEGWSGRASSSNGSGGWVSAFNTDITFGGESDVFVRIGFYTDGSVQDDGFAFDDFQLKEDAVAIDLRLDSIAPINSNCGLSATTPVTVIITNYGQNTLTNIPVTYYIGGTPMATETITTSLVGGQVFSYQFNQTADLSNPQGYILTASVDYVGDMDTTNNNSPPRSVVSYQVPTVIAFQGDEVCINGPANLFANTDIGVTRWYDAASGGTLLLTADNFPISNLTSTTTYYAEPFSPSIIPCVGIRQPVLADVSQTPQISFSGLQTSSLTIQFTSTLSGNTDSVWWDFGDFSAGTDDPNPLHVYPSAGTKAVILQGFDGSCDTAVTSAIFVLGLENGLASLIEIYPNPTPGSFQFKSTDLGGSIQIQLLDQKGVVVMEQDWKSDNGTYDRKVDLPSQIPAGIYHLRIVSGDRIGRIKIVKE